MPGIIFFGLIVWYSFRDLRFIIGSYDRNARDYPFLKQAAEVTEIAFLSYLLNSLFLPHEHAKYMWALFGLIAAMGHIRRRQLTAGAAPVGSVIGAQ